MCSRPLRRGFPPPTAMPPAPTRSPQLHLNPGPRCIAGRHSWLLQAELLLLAGNSYPGSGLWGHFYRVDGDALLQDSIP